MHQTDAQRVRNQVVRLNAIGIEAFVIRERNGVYVVHEQDGIRHRFGEARDPAMDAALRPFEEQFSALMGRPIRL